MEELRGVYSCNQSSSTEPICEIQFRSAQITKSDKEISLKLQP